MPAAALQARHCLLQLWSNCPNPGQTELRMMLTFCATARARGRSHRLLKFEHELVDRLAARRLDREVARILGVAPEIAFGDELESCRLDFAAQRAFLDAVEALADGCAVAGF